MGNWIVGGILAVIIYLIVRYLVKQWKAGHGFCVGGDCKSCGGHCSQVKAGCSGSCAECRGCSEAKKEHLL